MLNLIVQIVFFLSLTALVYAYVGYPILVFALSFLHPKRVNKRAFEPSVTVIITAYNEERDLRQKLENTLALDYPPEKLEILVASDGSTDRTDEIVKEFAHQGVRLYRQEGRLGKTSAQNTAVELANGEIIVFSDATTMYQKDVLRVIAPNFADQSVGCVAGKLIYVDPDKTNVGEGARSYWNYEKMLKEAESTACSLIGVSGCLYAVRRKNYVPMYPEACSDFLIATKIYEQGLRTVYEPAAVCTEETNNRVDKEMRMRVRIITQTYTDLWRHRAMMNPFRSGFYAIQLISHKVLRYSVPLFLVLLFASSLFLALSGYLFFQIILAAQAAFYGAAVLSIVLDKTLGFAPRVLALPQYFVLANVAAVLAAYKFWRGERFAVWQPIRETVKN
jgi:cellulose synthase/poly-beta-1,6-N-acetylglucosamine synthase-like glycosyltransferase